MMHGQGEMYYANGDQYSGTWVDDKKEGTGAYISTSKDRYELDHSSAW